MKQKIKLLYVEDNPADIALFENKIQRIQTPSIQLTHAEDYEEFRLKSNDKEFDIYFVDYHLSGLKNGLEIAAEIRDMGVNAPIVLLTGADQPFIRQNSSEVLVNDHILKGEVTSSLLERVIAYNISNAKHAKEKMRLQSIEQQSQKMQALGVLAGGVAHELNNMLHPISMAAENLEMEDFKDPSIIKNIEIITRNTGKSAKLIQNILSFSAIGGGDKTTINFADTVSKTIDNTCEFFPTSISINKNISYDVKEIEAFIGQDSLQHIVTNLLVNASQAMDGKGNIFISLSLSKNEEDFLDKEREYFLLQIRDEGPGIPEEIKQKIFDPFFTTKEAGKGTGLGLSIVHSIVKDWEGDITISDNEGGACFNIYVPIYEG